MALLSWPRPITSRPRVFQDVGQHRLLHPGLDFRAGHGQGSIAKSGPGRLCEVMTTQAHTHVHVYACIYVYTHVYICNCSYNAGVSVHILLACVRMFFGLRVDGFKFKVEDGQQQDLKRSGSLPCDSAHIAKASFIRACVTV